MTYYRVMMWVNIHEAKAHLSRYLEKVRKGEVVILCKRNVPVAEIRRLPARRRKKRPIGLAKVELRVPLSFFEPLPPRILEDFEGNS